MTEHQLTSQRIEAILRALPALLGLEPALTIDKEPLRRLLSDYYRLVEIAHYVRRGGIKAMIYRLETGKTTFVPIDYFDEAHNDLSEPYKHVFSMSQVSEGCLLTRLQQISAAEEEIVTQVLPKMDSILLKNKRLEAVLPDD